MSDGRRRRAMGRAVRGQSRSGCISRIVIALVIVAIAYFKFIATTDVVLNPYTDEEQRISLKPTEEIALGLQAVGQMTQQHGGLFQDQALQDLVDQIGQNLAAHTDELLDAGEHPIDYPYEFHLLADEEMINAFALPGGQIFITYGLLKELRDEQDHLDRDQLAAVLGHEIGHVIARHSNEQMAKAGLLQGIGSAVGTAVGGDDIHSNQHIAQMVNHVLSTRYGREDEYASDEIGAKLMKKAGYDPGAILGVMEVLRKAGGGSGGSEMMSTHPFPENRIDRLKNKVLPNLENDS